MSKEFSLPSPKSPELMNSLLKSFGENNWEVLESDSPGTQLLLESSDKEHLFFYIDEGLSQGSEVNISLYNKGRLALSLTQETGNSDRSHIKYYVEVVNGLDSLFYDSDGNMSPLRNVKGFPKKIDVDATASAFILQVIHGDFFTPQLIKAKK